MHLSDAIARVEAECGDPRSGIPEEVFLLLTRLTPMVNVDLLIRDDRERTLLTWREDIYHGSGWHIPGGVIRYKETAADRIRAVGRLELGCEVVAEDRPMALHECIAESQRNRAHCISFLYRCRLASVPTEALRYPGGRPRPGMFHFFARAPENLLQVHHFYKKYIDPQAGSSYDTI